MSRGKLGFSTGICWPEAERRPQLAEGWAQPDSPVLHNRKCPKRLKVLANLLSSSGTARAVP
jgi:hypothetical protein